MVRGELDRMQRQGNKEGPSVNREREKEGREKRDRKREIEKRGRKIGKLDRREGGSRETRDAAKQSSRRQAMLWQTCFILFLLLSASFYFL